MKIETKFDIGQRLYMRDADFDPCRVVRITISGKNLIYDVEYFINGELKCIALWEENLSDVQEGSKKVGMA